MVAAQQELASLPILYPSDIVSFAAVGITTAGQVLDHFPKRYEDRRRFDVFPTQESSTPVCLRGEVIDCSLRHFGPGRSFYEAIIMDSSGGVFGSGEVICRWFNMPYIKKLLAAGQHVIVYGRVKDLKGKLFIDHPEFEVIKEGDDETSIHVERIVPIYKNIVGITQRKLREIIHMLLLQTDKDSLGAVYEVSDFPRAEAIRVVHFPESLEQAQAARRRFALEEFFAIQLAVVWRKSRYSAQEGRVLGRKARMLRLFYENLPFDLTGAQKRSIKEIAADMRRSQPMHRLLQGDVGTGKTFVAMAAILLAIETGVQAALMAPTQILAEQHYYTFCRWLEPLGVRISLRSGNRDLRNFSALDREPQIIIGTHALLFNSVSFSDLGLIVIDEQHKFGVAQRARLINQGTLPDVLVMTATPIPRTLTMTVYGDLDVSLLDELPPGRGKIITGLRVAAKQSDITKFVKEQLTKGRQVYLVYPLVEDSESLKVESATTACEKWQKRLSAYQVELLHGKLRPEEKEEVMRRFRDGETSVLVATTVIEVGVDVPNASLMIIHYAERFGLAQLHQLRGRIGRGGNVGYCVLLSDGKSAEGMEKLKVLEGTLDGFLIAEADLRIRGPGDVLGSMQSGLSNLRFTDFLADTNLLREARALAEEVLRQDPNLSARHHLLRSLVDEGPSEINLPSTA